MKIGGIDEFGDELCIGLAWSDLKERFAMLTGALSADCNFIFSRL